MVKIKYSQKVVNRFWSKVKFPESIGTDECWEWQTSCTYNGYGQFYISDTKRTHRSNRVAYEITIGDIPDGMFVCHRCDNPKCVNPSHLWLGTASDNNKDAAKKGRSDRPCGENHPNHRLTCDDVQQIRLLHNTGLYTYQQLGSIFNVCGDHIYNIIVYKRWGHI